MSSPRWLGAGSEESASRSGIASGSRRSGALVTSVPGLAGALSSVDAGQLPAGTSTLSYGFDDPWGKGRHGSGTVERSDPMFAALVSVLAAAD